MYEVLAGNRVRKMPEMEKPDQKDYHGGIRNQAYPQHRDKYEEALGKQPVYPISGPHNWKEGQLIEEDKDFVIAGEAGEEEAIPANIPIGYKDAETGQNNPDRVQSIPSVTNEELERELKDFYFKEDNEEDELWVELVTEIDRFKDSELLYKYLKQSFTISRKPSSSSPSQLINKSK